MGDQPLIELTGEHRDAIHPGVVPEPIAGHADLAAAGLEQHRLIEVGPFLDRGIKSGFQCCGSGERGTHEPPDGWITGVQLSCDWGHMSPPWPSIHGMIKK